MVHVLRSPTTDDPLDWVRVVGRTAMVVLLWLGCARLLPAQQPEVHYLHRGVMPPGAIGSLQLQRGGPLAGFFQPVEIKAPPGALISLAVEGHFDQAEKAPLRVGMLIGQVYRLRVMNIPVAPGVEVFPTIELIDRLYTPASQQHRFAIPIEISLEDLRLAMRGKFVTRVIYLEDPLSALPVREDAAGGSWFEAPPGRDPLAIADTLGRPVAILRLGARLPDRNTELDEAFLFGCPPVVKYESPAMFSGRRHVGPSRDEPAPTVSRRPNAQQEKR